MLQLSVLSFWTQHIYTERERERERERASERARDRERERDRELIEPL